MERRKNYSKKREAILAYLRSTDAHPTAECVYRQLKPSFPDLSLGTVYRNLSLFKQEGVIGSACIEDGMERFDRNTAPHAHFVCNRCHRVMDLNDFDPTAEFLQKAAAQLHAQVDTCHLLLRGLCPACCTSAAGQANQ